MNKFKKWIIKTIVIAIIAAILVIVIVFSLHGTKTTSGKYPDPISNTSLMCKLEGLTYPFFSYDDSYKKETKITIIYSNNNIASASLMQTLYYESIESVNRSNTLNTVSMNKYIYQAGLTDKDIYYKNTSLPNAMQMTIYASGSNINEKTAPFFLLETNPQNFNIDQIITEYSNNNFKCTKS